MKRILTMGIVICLCVIMATTLVACNNSKHLKDAEYNNKVNEYAFWKNDITEAIPQIAVSHMIRDYLDTPSENGKAKKVLFLGYDGCRADMIPHILDVSTGTPLEGVDSAIVETMSSNDGGIYLSYAGGNLNTNTRQPTITGCGWGSLTTGVWANKHKIKDNRDVKNTKYTSFILDAATGKFNDGHVYSSAFISSCTQHFATQYIDEINYLWSQPKDGCTMPNIKVHDEFIRERHEWSENYHDDMVREYVSGVMANTKVPATYVFTPETGAPEGYPGYYGDVNTRNAMIDAINSGKDVIFGILDETDHVGHHDGFSKGNESNPTYIEAFKRQDTVGADVIRTAKKRASEQNEDWLIVMTTDHGGYDDYHGKHSFEERTIWVACNKPIDAKYYSREYDGFNGEYERP